jgi:hypothetical protein
MRVIAVRERVYRNLPFEKRNNRNILWIVLP